MVHITRALAAQKVVETDEIPAGAADALRMVPELLGRHGALGRYRNGTHVPARDVQRVVSALDRFESGDRGDFEAMASRFNPRADPSRLVRNLRPLRSVGDTESEPAGRRPFARTIAYEGLEDFQLRLAATFADRVFGNRGRGAVARPLVNLAEVDDAYAVLEHLMLGGTLPSRLVPKAEALRKDPVFTRRRQAQVFSALRALRDYMHVGRGAGGLGPYEIDGGVHVFGEHFPQAYVLPESEEDRARDPMARARAFEAQLGPRLGYDRLYIRRESDGALVIALRRHGRLPFEAPADRNFDPDHALSVDFADDVRGKLVFAVDQINSLPEAALTPAMMLKDRILEYFALNRSPRTATVPPSAQSARFGVRDLGFVLVGGTGLASAVGMLMMHPALTAAALVSGFPAMVALRYAQYRMEGHDLRPLASLLGVGINWDHPVG